MENHVESNRAQGLPCAGKMTDTLWTKIFVTCMETALVKLQTRWKSSCSVWDQEPLMSQPSQILASNEDCTWSHFLLFESSIVEDTSSGVSIFLTSSDFFAGRRSLMTIDNSIFYCHRFWQLFVGDWNSTNPLIAWIQFSPHKSNWHLGKIRARKRLSGHNHLLNLGWSENKEIPDRPGHFLSQKKNRN